MMRPVIQDVRKARLPDVYVEAQKALATCQRIDECKAWADKAAAIASYAKQAQDETLMDTATRIKARAIRRCGELLKEIESQQGGDRKSKGRDRPVDRKTAATNAGLSERQRKDALRVASIPEADFEEQVESKRPPTITELSETGKRQAANLAYLKSPKPPGFKEATHLLGELQRFAEFCERADVALVADALTKREATRVMRESETVLEWLKKLRRRFS